MNAILYYYLLYCLRLLVLCKINKLLKPEKLLTFNSL